VSFSKKPLAPGPEGAQHVLIGVERGQHDDLGRVGASAEQFGGGEAVDLGHPDVHEHHVRRIPVDRSEHLGPIGRLSHHVHVGRGVEDHRDRRPYQRIVVDDDDRKVAGNVSLALGVVGLAAALVIPLSASAALGVFALIGFHLIAGWKTYRLSTTN
jgi:hypothetical protein